MPTDTSHATGVHHRKRHLLERVENAPGLLVVGIIVALGLAMLIGLMTADGKVRWNS